MKLEIHLEIEEILIQDKSMFFQHRFLLDCFSNIEKRYMQLQEECKSLKTTKDMIKLV